MSWVFWVSHLCIFQEIWIFGSQSVKLHAIKSGTNLGISRRSLFVNYSEKVKCSAWIFIFPWISLKIYVLWNVETSWKCTELAPALAPIQAQLSSDKSPKVSEVFFLCHVWNNIFSQSLFFRDKKKFFPEAVGTLDWKNCTNTFDAFACVGLDGGSKKWLINILASKLRQKMRNFTNLPLCAFFLLRLFVPRLVSLPLWSSMNRGWHGVNEGIKYLVNYLFTQNERADKLLSIEISAHSRCFS